MCVAAGHQISDSSTLIPASHFSAYTPRPLPTASWFAISDAVQTVHAYGKRTGDGGSANFEKERRVTTSMGGTEVAEVADSSTSAIASVVSYFARRPF